MTLIFLYKPINYGVACSGTVFTVELFPHSHSDHTQQIPHFTMSGTSQAVQTEGQEGLITSLNHASHHYAATSLSVLCLDLWISPGDLLFHVRDDIKK